MTLMLPTEKLERFLSLLSCNFKFTSLVKLIYLNGNDVTYTIEDFLGEKLGDPNYVRNVTIQTTEGTQQSFLEMWIPRLGPQGGWICLIRAPWIDNGRMIVGTGDDEIEAILSAFYLFRAHIDSLELEVRYRGDDNAGFPLWPISIISKQSQKNIDRWIRQVEKEEVEDVDPMILMGVKNEEDL